MTIRYAAICAGAVLAAIAMQGTSAQALTMTECSAKYKAAKDAGTLNGMKWNDFRKAQCGSDAAAPARAAHHGICARRGARAGARTGCRAGRGRKRHVPERGQFQIFEGIPPARPAWKPASISTRPTRPATATAA